MADVRALERQVDAGMRSRAAQRAMAAWWYLTRQFDRRELMTFAGLGCLYVGVSGFSGPAGWVVLGIGLLYLGLWHNLVVNGRR
jgi:hypothetical protein